MNITDSPRAEPAWLSSPPTPDVFLDAAKKGLGRALLWLQRFDPKPYLPSIIDLNTKWLGWDLQCNGPFDAYTLELADLSGDPDACAKATFEAAVGDFDRSTAWHLDDLMYAWHLRGHQGAKPAIKAFFENELRQGRSVGGNAIILIDGYEGLKRVARAAAERLELDEWFWPERWIQTCRDEAGVEDADERLRAEAGGDPLLAAFVALVDADRERIRTWAGNDASTRSWTLDELIQMANDLSTKRWDRARSAFYWAGEAPESEWAQGARLLLESPNMELVIALRRAFTRGQGTEKFRPFPLGAEALADRVEDPSLERRSIVRWVLACQEGDVVRQTALRLLRRGDYRDKVIRMLQSRLEPADVALVMQVLSTVPVADEDQVHDVGRDILDVGEKHKIPELLPALRWVYEHGPCRGCRESAVACMVEIGDLPPDIKLEAAHDASADTRNLAMNGEYLEKQDP